MSESTPEHHPLPPDDLMRNLKIAHLENERELTHIGLVGDIHHHRQRRRHGRTLLRDRHAHSAGWWTAPHRHDFEETFIVLEGDRSDLPRK